MALQHKIKSIVKKRPFWQVVLAVLILSLTIFFIRNERLEIVHIREKLAEADPLYVGIGVLLTVVFVLLQGLMYDLSFRSIMQSIHFGTSINLYLKRNLIGVFLPAGNFSSVAFFNKPVEKHGITKVQIYFASYIYGLCGMLSVVVVAIPALLYLLLHKDLTKGEIYAFAGLIALTGLVIYLAWSFFHYGWVYKLLSRFKPDLALLLDELRSQEFSKGWFAATLGCSVLLEVLGIVHLYVSMLAIGVQPTAEAAIIGYIVMVMLLVASPFLKGLGAIEVSMTLVLTSYGYTTVAAASATLLFRLFEFWLPLLAGVGSFLVKKDSFVLRVLPAFIILGLGLVNIISAITPSIPFRLHMLEDIIPTDIIFYSVYFVLVAGVALCVLSYYLLRGVRSAWLLGVVLTFLSSLGHLAKGADYEEAILALVAFASLIITRHAYFLKPDYHLRKKAFYTVPIAIIAAFIYGVTGFYFLDKRHFGLDFNFQQSVETLFRMLFFFDTSGLHPRTHFAHFFQDSIYITGFAALIYTIYVFVKPYINRIAIEQSGHDKALELIRQYGKSPLDYFKTYPDKQLFFPENVEAVISFKRFQSFAAVLEDPVAKDLESMSLAIRAFDEYCYQNGIRSFYHRVPEEHLEIYHALRKRSLLIGQEAIVDLQSFSLEGGQMKSIRNAMKKVEGEGYQLRIYEPPLKEGLIQKLKQVSNEWLHTQHRKEAVFSQGRFDAQLIKENTVLTVESPEEKVVAFLNIVHDYTPGEGTYDLVRKSLDAPNGVIDFLVVHMFEYFRSQGCRYVNMGLAPLSGMDHAENLTERTIKYAYNNIRQFGHYRGLREYKEKFKPEWKNKYLVYNNNFELIQIPLVLREVSEPHRER